MGRIEDNGANRVQQQNQVQQQQNRVQNQPPVQPPAAPNNPANQRSEVQQYGDQQRLRLNNQVNKEQENNGVVAGGLAGSSAATFELNEQTVRNTGQVRIRGDWNTPPDFVDKVTRDLRQIAPGTLIETRPLDPAQQPAWDAQHGADTLAIIKPAVVRVPGHDQGYRLIDQLNNNSNPVNIHFEQNGMNAQAQYYANGQGTGTPFSPGTGSQVWVRYNPDTQIHLPTLQNGQVVSAPTSPAAILGHELVHASHAQRGTIDPRRGTDGGDHFLRTNGQFVREGNHQQIGLREEFRTVGFGGSRLGSEPTENSLRTELGINNGRASYLEQGYYPYTDPTTNAPININGQPGVNGYENISALDYAAGHTVQSGQNFANNFNEGMRNSRNGAILSAMFGGGTSALQGNDAQTVLTDAAIGAGSGVAEEVIQRAVSGPNAATTGMTNNALRTAASQVRGAAVAGAVINTAFTVHDQWNNLQSDATRSQAVGVIAGEAVVGAASGAAGAYAGAMAGAAIGSIVPGVGTVIGGVVGFAVGAAAGYLADQGLRGLGVDTLVAQGVTAAYDGISSAASTVAEGARNLFSGAASRLSSIFG